MRPENYAKVIELLDVVERELNTIAAAVGHVDFDTFVAQQSAVRVQV